MSKKAIQERYPKGYCHCYGCGTLNEHGLHILSYWDGKGSVCEFHPREYHIAMPGYVYGGLIASLIDCHSIGTAAAAAHQDRGESSEELPRFVTASLNITYLKPTPAGEKITIRAHASEVKGRKVIVAAELSAAGQICAKGDVVAVEMPDSW